jgi:hypothetical protein
METILNQFSPIGNFNELKKKVEDVFGDLNTLMKECPDIYAHKVIAHGFMEYCMSNPSKSIERRKRITCELEDELEVDIPIKETILFRELYYKYLKEEYLEWAKKNEIPEHLIEEGWKEYFND